MDLEDKEITASVKYNYFHKEQQNQKKGKINGKSKIIGD